MKTIYKVKNKLRWIVVLLITACLLVIGGFLLGEKPKTVAFAAETETITFEKGASVRLDTKGDTSGIRFTANLTNELYATLTQDGQLKENAVLGMMIVPQSYVDAYERDGATNYLKFFVTDKGIAQNKIAINFTADMLGKTATGYQMRGSLVNIYPQNYERDFRAIAYYSVANDPTDTSFASYQYFINQESRNVSQVSVLAIQNESKDKPEGYSEKELDILYTHTGGAIPRVLYDASKQNNVQLLTVNENATLSQEDDNFKIALTETPATNMLVITPTFRENATLQGYTEGNIYFTIKVNVDGAICSAGDSVVTLAKDVETTISVPARYYVEQEYSIIVNNLTEAAEVLISDIAICARHNSEHWANVTGINHFGNCEECYKLVRNECIFVGENCILCGASSEALEWNTYVFSVLDESNTLHIFNRKLSAEPTESTELPLEDGTKVKGTPYQAPAGSYDAEKAVTLSSGSAWTNTTTATSIRSKVTRVVVEDAFAPISMANWFSKFTNCTSMELSRLDTSNVTSMASTFSECEALTSLNVSNFDTSNVTDMSSTFYSCEALTSLDLSSFDTSNVTTMDKMFGYSGYTILDLSNFDTSNVTDMGSMFAYCKQLKSLDVSNFVTSNVTDMSYMFSTCQVLTSLDLSSFDTSSVTTMSTMFRACKQLATIDLRKFDTRNVKTMYYMFGGCSALTEIDLSSFNTEKLTAAAQMFYACSSLVTIYVGEGWTNKNITSGSMMFGSKTAKLSNLVGGNGIKWNQNNANDQTYAVVGTAETPGYLTYKA